MDHSQHQRPDRARGIHFRAKWVLLAFIAIAAYFLVTEHRAHMSGLLYYLPFLLLLSCPIMHLFMHHGHHAHGAGAEHKQPRGEVGVDK